MRRKGGGEGRRDRTTGTKQKSKWGQKEEDGRGEQEREGESLGVLIETRTKASGGRAKTAGEMEKREVTKTEAKTRLGAVITV